MSARLAPSSAHGNEGLMLWMLVLPILGASFLSKLALPLVKVDGLGLGFPLIYLAMLPGLFVAGVMRFEAARLQFFCLMAAVLGGMVALRGDTFSLMSLAFLMLLHLPYIVQIEASEEVRERVRNFFLNTSLIVACCGLAQYVLQHVVAAAYVFPIENFMPASWRVTGFNMQIPIAWGSSIYRPNGIFMQEPSFFSQFLAIAVLLELCGPSRLWRVALYGIAILASQSGTGLILLAVCLPVLIVRRRRLWHFLVGAVLSVPLLILASPWLHIDRLVGRLGEFTSTRSSAYERFVGGFHIFDSSLGSDAMRMLFGYGAGSYREVVQSLGVPAAEMALFKMVVEFGVIGALLYFGFMFFCIFRTKGPLVIRLALALCLFLNGAYNTFVHSLALALLVWPSPAASDSQPDPQKRIRTRTSTPSRVHRDLSQARPA
jgi:hypothetical protein